MFSHFFCDASERVCCSRRRPVVTLTSGAEAEVQRPAAEKPTTDEMLLDSLDNALLKDLDIPARPNAASSPAPQPADTASDLDQQLAGATGRRRRPRAAVAGSAGHHRPPDAAGRKPDQPPSDFAKDAARAAAGDRGLGAVDRGNEEAVPGRPRQVQVGGRSPAPSRAARAARAMAKTPAPASRPRKAPSARKAKRRTAKNWRGSSGC